MTTIDNFCIVFICIVVLLYVISMIIRFSVYDIPQNVKYIEQSELNTGDLVCVSYNNFAGAFVGSFTHSIWVHTGIIWRDPETNVKYVFEGAIYGHSEYRDFYMIPITTWMYINRNNLMGYKKYNGPIIDENLMIKTFIPFMEKTKLEGLNPWWLRFLVNSDYQDYKFQNKITCFESTIVIGQNVGIFTKEKHFSSYFPCDVINGKITYNNNISYDKTIQIQMDDIEKKMLFSDMIENSTFWKK